MSVLIAVNIAVWAWAFFALHDNPILLGTAFLAYSFGLRHAVDADHIAAIDNVTRKLMQEGKKPLTVGLFFSLGHSTVVVLASIGIAITAMAFKDQMEEFHPVGGMIGTSVSAAFLLLIGAINLVVLINVYKAFRRVKNGGTYSESDLDILMANGGFFARIFRRLFSLIGRSWHMYPLGFLFGLGFDTATEVALLGITAAQASSGLSMWSILIFPALFTAGMTLLDTTDSVLDGSRLWLGFRQAGTQALLQHDDYVCFRCRRGAGRRNRSARTDRREVRPARRAVGSDRRIERRAGDAWLSDRRHLHRQLAALDADLPAEGL